MIDDDPLWYKDAIIYEAHVKSFFDSTNDGIGDFRGLTSKLDYLQELGITCLWLLPFFPSPLKDDGYDIADYKDVHPSYGTLDHFRAFVGEAHARGIRVLIELVVNHTSDQHPWFQAARRAPRGSREREFYVWSDTDQKFPETRIIFTDTEKSNWTYDPVAGQYYWHRFFSHQPDLNHNNPDVVEAVIDVMKFWLDMGVDALRLDAVPYLCVREGTNNENLPETHAVLKRVRRELDGLYRGRMLLAEANQWPADVRPYFGDGDECHMAFHFPLMPRIFMAIRQEDRHPITEIIRQTPDIPANCQWALFLRNHDELTLEMVTDEERDYMYTAYATDPMMRLNVGIRRRLAPLMENSRRRMELLNVLLFSLPGTPIVYYGDELGMGDNIYLGDRNGVRTPMQWSGDRNAGFSHADPARLYAPVIMDPVYGYQSINVEAQERYAFSLLNWMKRLIALRKRHTLLGRGAMDFVRCSNRKVLAYVRRDEHDTLLVVANLSRNAQPAELDLKAFGGLVPVELFGDTEFPRIGELPFFVTLTPYAYYIFSLQHSVEPITARGGRPEPAVEPAEEVPALLAGVAWDTLLEPVLRRYIEREALVPFLRRQRWFGSHVTGLRAARFVDWGLLRAGSHPIFATMVEAEFENGTVTRYNVPLSTVSGPAAEALLRQTPGAVLARITGARKGLLVEALSEEHAPELLLDAIATERTVTLQHGVLRARKAASWLVDRQEDARPVQRMGVEQSNTSVRFGARKILKWYRRIEMGPHPELEIVLRLADVGFDRVPPLAGWFEYSASETAAAGILHGLVHNQGDAWERTLDELGRYFERVTAGGAMPKEALVAKDAMDLIDTEVPEPVKATLGVPQAAVATLGRRTAEMHLALASFGNDPAFAPEPFTSRDVAQLTNGVASHIEEVTALLIARRDTFDEPLKPFVDRVRERAGAAQDRLRKTPRVQGAGARIRTHGDYHLGQVLWSEDDFFILDFEGEPARPLHERRAKESPLRDVAGMIRSFGYAGSVATQSAIRLNPGSEPIVEAWAAVWETWISAVFLQAYLAACGPSALLPSNHGVLARLLNVFILDKALYELRYELNNRPDWVHVPLRAAARLL
jgi:maltose alpha-D-glucosyltransferase / alpha-amylase